MTKQTDWGAATCAEALSSSADWIVAQPLKGSQPLRLARTFWGPQYGACRLTATGRHDVPRYKGHRDAIPGICARNLSPTVKVGRVVSCIAVSPYYVNYEFFFLPATFCCTRCYKMWQLQWVVTSRSPSWASSTTAAHGRSAGRTSCLSRYGPGTMVMPLQVKSSTAHSCTHHRVLQQRTRD
jgi:hypothetical protein